MPDIAVPFVIDRLGFDPAPSSAPSSAPSVVTLADATGLVGDFSAAPAILIALRKGRDSLGPLAGGLAPRD